MKVDERVIKSFEENQRAIEENLMACERTRGLAEKNNVQDVIFIININQFVMLFNYDLSVLRQDLLATEAGWRRKLHARLLALTIVEFLEDVGELLGKSFRAKVVETGDKTASIDRLNSILKKSSQLRVTHEKALRDLRNIAIGHKDKDAKKQFEVIRNLDVDRLESLGVDMTNWVTSYSLFLTDLIMSMTRQAKWV
jgi:hypothetical protein